MFELVGNEARVIAALGVVLAYSAYCFFQYRRFRLAEAGPAARVPLPSGHATEDANSARPIWVIHASQSGQAEAIAQQSVAALTAAGRVVRTARIESDWITQLGDASYVLFVVSTHGEGDAPDHATRFVRTRLQAGAHPGLKGVSYGLLALGDRNYAQFCGFGRALDAWLLASGALALFPRIEANRLDAQSLVSWSQALGKLGTKHSAQQGSATQAATIGLTQEAGFAPWHFVERTQLNAGSAGLALCKVRLKPASIALPSWQAGDLAEVVMTGEARHPRSYSIANLPEDGVIELIVRTRVRDDGLIGKASGWLNETARVDDMVMLRVRRNAGFRLEAGTDTPLILIGAGAGLAGLRGHLMARAQALRAADLAPPERCAWLIFGERSAEHDRPCADEFARWQNEGVLTRADFTFSRDDSERPYVQHVLREQAQSLRDWLEHGACVLVCGAAKTMGHGVDEALREVLGSDSVDALVEAGRIRRDVF